MGKNGTGKTTFLNNLNSNYTISYKKQYINFSEFDGVPVETFLSMKIKLTNVFISDIIKPLNIMDIYNKDINKLSGGEAQRVAIALCLGTPADIYLLDEPSASLDIEQRVIATKCIKRFLIHNNKLGFIVEHDIMMAMTLGADRIIVFSEHNRISNSSNVLQFKDGINLFFEIQGITFRSLNGRPKINKLDGQKGPITKKE